MAAKLIRILITSPKNVTIRDLQEARGVVQETLRDKYEIRATDMRKNVFCVSTIQFAHGSHCGTLVLRPD
jgi:hypothetical protein